MWPQISDLNLKFRKRMSNEFETNLCTIFKPQMKCNQTIAAKPIKPIAYD